MVSSGGGGDKEARKRARKSSESATQRQRRDSTSASASKETTSPAASASKSLDTKQIRGNALKGIREALRIRITKAAETKCTNEDLDRVGKLLFVAAPRTSLAGLQSTVSAAYCDCSLQSLLCN